MASPAIRHMGTIGGNIGNASPAGDTLPVLYVYDCKIVLESLREVRTVPIEDFITGPGMTVRRENEVIREIILCDLEYKDFYYEKVGPRRSDAISKLSFIGLYDRNEKGLITDIRLALGSVYETVVRDRELERQLTEAIKKEEARPKTDRIIGVNQDIRSSIVSIISENSIKEVLTVYEQLIQPIDDQRSMAKYRKKCSMNLLKSFVQMIGGK